MTRKDGPIPDLDQLHAAKITGGRLTVDLGAIADNYRILSSKARGAETGAAVKANAYGTGIAPVARTLANEGCRNFFVALPHEGVELRAIDPSAAIYVLGSASAATFEYLLSHNLTPVLNTMEDVAAWQDRTGQDGAGQPPFALHVDTGMNRLGISLADASSLAGLKPDLVMSHFACADEPDHPLNQQQMNDFNSVRKLFPEARASLANSAGILNGCDCHFDINRPGIALYGGGAVNGMKNPMRPVVKLEGRILQIRDVPAGDTIGYGGTHKFARNSRVAIVGIGYADGYLRAASGSGTPLRTETNGGFGMIEDQRVPIVGRISMDLTAFDVTTLPNGAVVQNDWITLLNDEITVDDLAKSAGTIGYEILTSLGRRFARTYING